jgi:hypothetical protein
MKKTIPQQEVHVCDLCGRDGYLLDCHVCGREFCLGDQGTVPQSWNFTQLCRECAHREDVQNLCITFAKKLTPIFSARNKALKQLSKKPSVASETALR